MSGHSKWSTIKHQKAANDKKRGQLFTKLIRAVRAASREGGADPATNAKLRLAIDRAKVFNVPKDNIERALSQSDGEAIETFAFDAIGPGGVTMIIEGSTDNRNRTLSEVRHLLTQHGAKLAQEGSARWAFSRRGLLNVERGAGGKNDEELMLTLIAAGAEDVVEKEDAFEVIVPQETFDAFRKNLAERNIPVADATLGWVPQQSVDPAPQDRTTLEKIVLDLDDHQDVQSVWTNET